MQLLPFRIASLFLISSFFISWKHGLVAALWLPIQNLRPYPKTIHTNIHTDITITKDTSLPYIRRHRLHRPTFLSQQLQQGESNEEKSDSNNNRNENTGIDVSVDPRLYRIRLPRATGIEWATDLSFSFVYVRALDPSGPASLSERIEKGHLLCELQAVVWDPSSTPYPPMNLIGASFDTVMNAFAQLDKTIVDIDLVFFRGSKEDLIDLCNASQDSKKSSSAQETISIQVIQKNQVTHQVESMQTIQAKKGSNLRQVLVDHGINVYQSFTRWTNCKGKQLCGTCIVNVTEGSMGTNRKSMDEASTLRENPESYRLSCVTFVYENITVETFPPIQVTQWTR